MRKQEISLLVENKKVTTRKKKIYPLVDKKKGDNVYGNSPSYELICSSTNCELDYIVLGNTFIFIVPCNFFLVE